MKYACLIFCEGKKDKKFLNALIDLPKFKYHTKNWFFTLDNASGSSPKIILEQCKRMTFGRSYDLILCFIDLDKLKSEYPSEWQKKKMILEEKFFGIYIIWQIDNAEDEYKRVIGGECLGKHKLNVMAKRKIKQFINSDFWKRILEPIRKKEN